MKFSELPNCSYFVELQPDKEVQLLAKDSKGQIRTGTGWNLIETSITPDTEVQQVFLKKRSCEE